MSGQSSQVPPVLRESAHGVFSDIRVMYIHSLSSRQCRVELGEGDVGLAGLFQYQLR